MIRYRPTPRQRHPMRRAGEAFAILFLGHVAIAILAAWAEGRL